MLNREWSPPVGIPDSRPGDLGNEDSQDRPTEDFRPVEKYQPKATENLTTKDDDQENDESNEVILTTFWSNGRKELKDISLDQVRIIDSEY